MDCMRRNAMSPQRDRQWTAWDCKTKWYRQPSAVRKRIRRIIKRRANDEQMNLAYAELETENNDSMEE